MPPDGYTTVTLPDGLIAKLSRIMVAEDGVDGYREAVETAVNTHLQDGDDLDTLTDHELAQLLVDRLDDRQKD